MPFWLTILHNSILLNRRLLRFAWGFDLFSSHRFAEWMICKYCELAQTPHCDDGGDGFDSRSGTFVEIASSHKVSAHHDGFPFRNLVPEPKGGREISCHVLLMFDLRGRTEKTLHFFVIPPDHIPKSGSMAIRLPIEQSKWSQYEQSLGELRGAVRETIDRH